jgi:hypothetical protein
MRFSHYLVAVLLLSGSAALAQSDFYLPQIADGRQGETGPGIHTTFVVFNPTSETVGAELSLTDHQGAPLILTIPALGTGSEFSVSLGPGETQFLETAGQTPLQVGAATISATGPLGVSAMFTIVTSDGGFITEAGVGHAVPVTSLALPVDATGPFDTGVAIFNTSLAEAPVTFRLFNSAGALKGQTTRTLAGYGHEALFVTQLFGGLGSFRGMMVVESVQPIAAVALRQNLNTLTSTTLPVTSSLSQRKEFRLPQVAKGTYGGGSIRTSFLVFNLSPTEDVDVDVNLTTDAGQPFPVTIAGAAQNQAVFRVSLGPRASAFLDTDSAGPVVAGAASVVASGPIGVSSIFTLYDTQGSFQTEAGVGDSLERTSFTVPVDSTAAFDTGVALFNAGPVASMVTIRLLDATGARVGAAEVELVPSGHTAFLVKQEFGGASLRGSLAMTATAPVSALTLRLNASPLSYTTLPAASGAFAGFVPRPALLPRRITGVSAVSPSPVEVALDAGFKLTGRILGAAASVDGVFAQSQEGGLFTAGVDTLTRRYSVTVPAGSYTVIVCYKKQTTFAQGAAALTFEDAQPVVVSGDTSHDVTLPDTPLFRVSGNVTDLGQQLVSALLRFTRSDGAAGADGLISLDRRFSVSLPAGSYSVSMVVNVFGDYGSNRLALYGVGALVVADADVAQDFALPALWTLRGATQVSGMTSIRPGSFVSAVDTAAPPPPSASCLPDTSQSRLSMDLAGAFRATLSAGHGFDLQAHVLVAEDSFLIFPASARHVTLTGNVQQNFSAVAAPTMVNLAGVVRGPGGDPVDGVTITASSVKLTGLEDARALATGRSNSLGEFTLTVPAGGDYELDFFPPAP